MSQHEPIAERYPALLRLLEESQPDVQCSESTMRHSANQEFIRSLSLLEHTLSGEEEIAAVTSTADAVLTELDELADAVADIEAYMKERQHHPTLGNSDGSSAEN